MDGKPASKKKKSEEIFKSSELTPMALDYKRLIKKGDEEGAAVLLEKIIIGSTQMFIRLAQHEGYHRTVDVDRLVSAAQSKVIVWLMAWNIKKGPLFSWFSKCSKYAFLSEVSKENLYRTRYHVTSDNLEAIFGAEDHESIKEATINTDQIFKNIFVRWGSEKEQNAIRHLLRCIVDDDHDKRGTIKGTAFAWGISIDLSKFFYNWCLMELRDQMYTKIRVPFTEQDLFRHANSYNHLPDLLNIITWEQMKKLIAVMGGSRLKIPTMSQMVKLAVDYKIAKKIDESDKSIDTITAIAKDNRRSVKTACQSYAEMVEILDAQRNGEHELFPNH